MCNQMFRVRASRISLFFYSNTEKSSVSISLNIYRVTLSPNLYILFIFAIFFAHFQLMFCNWRCQREYRPLFVLRGGQTSADIGSGQKPGIIGNKGNRVIHHGSVLQCCRLQCCRPHHCRGNELLYCCFLRQGCGLQGAFFKSNILFPCLMNRNVKHSKLDCLWQQNKEVDHAFFLSLLASNFTLYTRFGHKFNRNWKIVRWLIELVE